MAIVPVDGVQVGQADIIEGGAGGQQLGVVRPGVDEGDLVQLGRHVGVHQHREAGVLHPAVAGPEVVEHLVLYLGGELVGGGAGAVGVGLGAISAAGVGVDGHEVVHAQAVGVVRAGGE
jgi:hypothetical protein